MAENPGDAAASAPSPAMLPRIRRAPPEVGKQLSAAETAALLQLADTVRAFSDGGVPVVKTPVDEAPAPKGFRFQRHTTPQALADPALAPARPASPAPAKTASILRQHPILVWVVVQIFGLGLLAAGVFLGEWDARPAQPAPTNGLALGSPPPAAMPPVASVANVDPDAALREASLAMTREDFGGLRSAHELLDVLARPPDAAPGAEYELALLDLRRGDRASAEQHLARSIAAGQAVAPCRYLQGALAGQGGDFRQAAAQLRLAVQAEPFSGRYFFYWGEALRRAGQPREAALRLQAALARPLTSDEWQLYYFKLRLAEVEAGPADPFAAELQTKLEQPSPAGDWLLLAAAQSVQNHGFMNAAHYLKEASRQVPPQIYRTWVSDYIFQQYVSRVELERFILVPPPAATLGGVLVPLGAEPPAADLLPNPTTLAIAPPVEPPDSTSPPATTGLPDPTVCPASEADPALWKSAPGK